MPSWITEMSRYSAKFSQMLTCGCCSCARSASGSDGMLGLTLPPFRFSRISFNLV